jgi:hypothetical protein
MLTAGLLVFSVIAIGSRIGFALTFQPHPVSRPLAAKLHSAGGALAYAGSNLVVCVAGRVSGALIAQLQTHIRWGWSSAILSVIRLRRLGAGFAFVTSSRDRCASIICAALPFSVSAGFVAPSFISCRCRCRFRGDQTIGVREVIGRFGE